MFDAGKSASAELINSADGVIDTLGGNSEVAKLFDDPITPNAVGNWRERGFPPETFIVLTTALNARGLYAPPTLWKMRAPIESTEARWPA